MTELNPVHVNIAEAQPCDARTSKVKIFIQIMIENRIQIDKTTI